MPNATLAALRLAIMTCLKSTRVRYPMQTGRSVLCDGGNPVTADSVARGLGD
jgi:hypothetical protein